MTQKIKRKTNFFTSHELPISKNGFPNELHTSNTVRMMEKPLLYEYEIELNEFAKKHTELVLLGNVLLVEAHRKEKKDEFCYKTIINVPEEGDTQKIKASFKKGILYVLIPKLKHSKLKAIHIPLN